MYAQFLIHISMAKSAYNNRESTIFYYNSITLSASYGHVTFIASRPCQNLVGLASVQIKYRIYLELSTKT